MPRFFSMTPRFFEISSSHVRIRRLRTAIVTSQPKFAKTEANSTAITPPPSTSSFFFTEELFSSSSSLVMTPGRSLPGNFVYEGFEPLAIRMFSAFKISSVPSAETNFTLPRASIVPVPSSRVTLLAFRSCSTPLLRRLTV